MNIFEKILNWFFSSNEEKYENRDKSLSNSAKIEVLKYKVPPTDIEMYEQILNIVKNNKIVDIIGDDLNSNEWINSDIYIDFIDNYERIYFQCRRIFDNTHNDKITSIWLEGKILGVKVKTHFCDILSSTYPDYAINSTNPKSIPFSLIKDIFNILNERQEVKDYLEYIKKNQVRKI